MSTRPRRLVTALLVVCGAPLAAQTTSSAASGYQGLPADVQQDLAALAGFQPDSSSPAARRKVFRRVLAVPAAHAPLAAVIDSKLAALERQYARLLDAPIRAAYHRRLFGLSNDDLRRVARTRRLWRGYLRHTSTQLHFQQHFLQPAVEVGKLLIPDIEGIRTRRSDLQRKCMAEFNGYRAEVRAARGLGEDPTEGVQASTGIPLPPLFQVRTYEQHLAHLHRTMAVASSVAPFEAESILLDNAVKARFIDYQEAEFVLFANEVRMLMGTVAWATDIAACAATRDHSKDRAEGRAKGHISSVPGKRGFTHRLRRFGTRASSEGAGGGGNGRAYLRNLSYGGGHTGPLYSSKRNVVGVGRYGNVYTSTYAGNQGAVHSAPVLEREEFMPPGIPTSMVLHADLMAVCNELKVGDYGRATALLTEVDVDTALDKFLKRYLGIAIAVEADWQLECMARVEAVGDLFGVQQRIAAAREVFGTSLDKRLAPFEKRLQPKAARRVVDAGRAYAEACAAKDPARIRAVIDAHPKTVYANAARAHLQAGGKQGHPLQWFLTQDGYLNRFGYLAP